MTTSVPRATEVLPMCQLLIMLLFQLEQERCDLLEELHSIRDKLSLAEKELRQKSDRLKQLSTNYDKQTKSLNEQITEVWCTCPLLSVLLSKGVPVSQKWLPTLSRVIWLTL